MLAVLLSALAVAANHWTVSSAFGQASFQGLGDLPGGAFKSWANDVSGDGSVIVEASFLFGILMQEAFRWTAEEGMQPLGFLSGGSSS